MASQWNKAARERYVDIACNFIDTLRQHPEWIRRQEEIEVDVAYNYQESIMKYANNNERIINAAWDAIKDKSGFRDLKDLNAQVLKIAETNSSNQSIEEIGTSVNVLQRANHVLQLIDQHVRET